MAHSSSDLSSLLQTGSPNQRISFSVRVRNASMPQSSDNIGLPWIHVDLLPGSQLSETMDYRFRPYSVSQGPAWRHKSNLCLDSDFEQNVPAEQVVDSFEDVYFPVDIPSVASIDLIGCLYCLNSIMAGYAPAASTAISSAQADEELCGGDDEHLHKKTPKFTQFEPLWSIKLTGTKFESLSANSDSKFSKTTLIPPKIEPPKNGGGKTIKPVNVLRFEMSSARKAVGIENSSNLSGNKSNSSSLSDQLVISPPAAKRSRLRVKVENLPDLPRKSPVINTMKTTAIKSVISSTTTTTTTTTSSSTTTTTLDQMPPELIFQIVSLIQGGPHFQLRAVTSLSGVNRRLRAICSDQSLFSCLDLKPSHLHAQRLTQQFVTFLAQRTLKTKSLRLSWLPWLSQSRSPLKIDRLIGQELTTLITSSCPLVDDDFLRQLCRSNADKLQTLDLSSCWSISRRGFGCLDSLRSLRRLSLAQTLISQKTLEILLVALGPRLEVLNLSSLHDIANMDVICGTLSENAPNLTALDLSDSPSLSPLGLGRLGKGCQRLEELTLLQCGIVASIGATQIAVGSWHQLRRLVIHVSDVNALEMLASESGQVPLLEQLAVTCFRRSGAPISCLALLLAAFPRLCYLKVPVEWPSASDFEESRRRIIDLRQRYPQCAIQTQ